MSRSQYAYYITLNRIVYGLLNEYDRILSVLNELQKGFILRVRVRVRVYLRLFENWSIKNSVGTFPFSYS